MLNSFAVFFLSLFRPHLGHMEVPGPGVDSELQLNLYLTPDLNPLYHSGNPFYTTFKNNELVV